MQRFIKDISKYYDEREARAVFYRLMEDKYGLSRVDLCLGGITRLTLEQQEELTADVKRLAEGEPVQYVVGFEYFHGLRFSVQEGVLIPRPETAELVDMIISDAQNATSSPLHVLDIGSGSGAIGISIASELGAKAKVSQWDISDIALETTRRNAAAYNVSVCITKQDALNPPFEDCEKWDIIVSNPPYICNAEASEMNRNVLDYEPELALFVPDDDPLLFYRAIAEYAKRALKPGGGLYFEINEHYADDTKTMLSSLGFERIEAIKDQFGKYRFTRCFCTK